MPTSDAAVAAAAVEPLPSTSTPFFLIDEIKQPSPATLVHQAQHSLIDFIKTIVAGSLISCPTKNGSYTSGMTTMPLPPSASIFLRDLPLGYTLVLVVASLLCVANLGLSATQLLYVHNYVAQPNRRLCIFYLASTAPFVSVLSLVAMYMPRVWFLAHLVGFMYFALALWVIIRLLLNIFGGRAHLVALLMERRRRFRVNTPPCCCVFPCLPQLEMDSRRVRMCEWAVLQSVLVRMTVSLMSLVVYFEYAQEGMLALKVLDAVALPSLLLGIYGMHVLVTTVSSLDELRPHRYGVVFRLLDLFFMFFGCQPPLFDLAARWGLFECGHAGLPALETAFFWKNGLVVVESLLVTILATWLLQPSQSAFFDKYPSCRSLSSTSTCASYSVRPSTSTSPSQSSGGADVWRPSSTSTVCSIAVQKSADRLPEEDLHKEQQGKWKEQESSA